MPDFGLFLTFQFQQGGNFDDNGRDRIRRPDARFWDMVLPDPNNNDGSHYVTRNTRRVEILGTNPIQYTSESTRINADTRTMEMVARAQGPTDRVFFAVNLHGGPANLVISNIRF